MALDAVTAPVLDDSALLSAQTRAADALIRRQKPDGHFVFELEADATIPAEYVLLEHFLAQYVSMNSFSQLAVRTRQRKEILKEWAPRSGNRILL